MDLVRKITLLAKNAYVLQEDLRLMEQGALTVHAFGIEVTSDCMARLKGNLTRLNEVLDCYCRESD